MDSGFSVEWLWFRRLMIGWFDGMDERMLTKGVLRPFELFTVSRCGVMASGFASFIVQGHGRMLVGVESYEFRDDRVLRTTTRVGVIGFASVVQGHGRMLVGLRVMDSGVRTE